MKTNYYEIKYPMWYPYSKPNGERGIMYTIPVKELVKIYSEYTGQAPKTFFDCGAGNGQLLIDAEKMNISASGVDKERYSITTQAQKNLIEQGKLQIMPIEECQPVKADLVFCNGVLTYMDDVKLGLTMSKFAESNIIIVSHDTIDDAISAIQKGMTLPNPKDHRLKPIIWWVAYFQASGFDTRYNFEHQCFVLTPLKQKYKMREPAKKKSDRKLRIYPKIDLEKNNRNKLRTENPYQITMQEKAKKETLLKIR